MKKIMIFCVCIVVLIAVLIIGNMKETTIATGTLVDNGETEVTITITRTNFGKLFNWISKPVLIKVGDETYEYEITGKRLGIYNLGSKIYTFEDIRHFSIGRYDNTVGSVMGTLYFSNNMKNIAIITNYESIYSDSADEAFLKSMFPEN